MARNRKCRRNANANDQTEADVIKRESATRQNSAAPINQLAREILAEIFWNCIPIITDSETPVAGWMSSRDAPFLLCSICSSWRAITLNAPKLWTTVVITIRGHDKDLKDPKVARRAIGAWLERSKTLPLALYLHDMTYGFSKRRNTLLDAVFSTLYSHSTRWQRVFFHFSDPWSSYLSFPQLDTPLLRSFIVEADIDEEETIPLPFCGNPHLEQLHWSFPIDIPRNPQIQWDRMSDLRISFGMTFFLALEAIRSCSQLEKFDVDVATASYNTDDGRIDDGRLPLKPVVENGSLKVLRFLVFQDCSPLLNSLTLPALKDFTLDVFIPEEFGDNEPRQMIPAEPPAFLGLLTRSGCQLDRLKLGHCAFDASVVVECLEHKSLETVQAFTIENLYYQPTLNDTVLTRLTNITSSPLSIVLLPKLTHLTLELCLRSSSGVLGRMVHSRRCLWKESGTAQLESFSFLGGTLSPDDDNLVCKAVSDGLHASIDVDPSYDSDDLNFNHYYDYDPDDNSESYDSDNDSDDDSEYEFPFASL